MKRVAIVGWRGMVGSVLMERMQQEGDLNNIEAYLFSTSMNGEPNNHVPECHDLIMDSDSVEELVEMDIIVTCQGSDYSKGMLPKLRDAGWEGYWIDSASAFRMRERATIVLDPVNKPQIERAIHNGQKDFIGGNCTVSVMLMALGGLFEEDLIEWLSAHTYQAASGAGAKEMIELLDQSHFLTSAYFDEKNPAKSALEYEKVLVKQMRSTGIPREQFGRSLAFSLFPWIDRKMDTGQSREEWKARAEANKILGTSSDIPIDGTCVRIGSLRCHAEAFTIKLKKNVDIGTIEDIIASHNDWVQVVPNEKEATLKHLTPQKVSGTLQIPVGRIRKMNMGDSFLNAFTVGDQLLWGAAEPLRRVLHIILSQ